ncbi:MULTISPECIES: ectoine hydroxylase [unclassified Halomonas]|jgi:ectoine hydroxylase|uniref:ectoine hydroxylase n=1 Tax=Halomonadaceae TaxID=28256 RepID=UPI001EF60649|nr:MULTISPECIES: ectoine hydroxylase [unclassified Halomonas]MCG7577854.1 ectoine hydroxylase [Halomonas sp. MMH1-48]MCG7591061.1 ectoine hydroxylase [Halomonas sp. McD50-5]MCG7604920.1 ectoine hydroxylase [Halomonas sp. MM17-34]MCG7614114.1 ectoine hydroxylase [Halomonas sp. MM17-29]MCG7617275.1 ectoine hydroxylase [Halomonas sp. McD50-4]
MTVSNTPLNHVTAHKQYSEMADVPTAGNARVVDAYPTRLAQAPASLTQPRQDGVVKGRALPGPLSEAQLDEFERKGYLFIPNLIDGEELEALRQEMNALLSNDAYRDKAFSITEPESHEIRSLFAVHRLSERLGALASDERVAGAARQIIGDDPYVHQSRINYKPGFAGKGFNWHSDFETWHAEDGMPNMHAVSASLILTDNHEFNGPLMLIPGSHMEFVPCLGETPEDNHKRSLKAQEVGVPSPEALTHLVDKYGIDAPKGKAGGLLLFDCNTLHASNANLSPDPRSNVFFVFNRPDNRCVAPFAAPKQRPSFLAHGPEESGYPEA